jgi:hypothetical protein
MKKVLGIDIGNGSVVTCILSERPPQLKEYLRANKKNFRKYEANSIDMKALLSEDFSYVVMEPTGAHYSKIWSAHLEAAGKEILWVGHEAISNHRKAQRLPGKNDEADALALADYGIEHLGDKEFFLNTPFSEIRDISLQLQSLNRMQHPVVARLRQQMAHEWPEKKDYTTKRVWLDPKAPALWRYLAGEEGKANKRYDKELDESIGAGVSEFSKMLAEQICSLEKCEYEIEVKLEILLREEKYKPYMRAFGKLQFGNRLSGIILSHIYPIEKFLGPNGKVRNEHVTTARGKRSRRNRSLSAFKLSLGMGMVQHQSGDTDQWKAGGPKNVRVQLWLWAKTAVIMRKPKTEETLALREIYDLEKENGVKAKIRTSRVCSRGVKKVFNLILKEME